MAKTYRIETERLVIRCYQPQDAKLLKEAIDVSIEHLKPWLTWATDEPEPLQSKIDRLQRFRGQFDLGVDFIFGIFSKDESELIGSTGLHNRIGDDAREIGYWISVEHVKRGYALENVMALVKVGFELEGLDRIEIHCAPQNIGSRRIPEKLGFTHEGTLRRRIPTENGQNDDEMIWTLFADEYQRCAWKDIPIRAFDVVGNLLSV
ncbi:MAG: GNAT family N-acetyltransferase [Saprospiraceae bacterium]|nr:GNAT family N-acetyltransferase [Saprospiraceae bacterium]